MEQPNVPQPQPSTRGAPASRKAGIIVAALLASLVSSAATFAVYYNWAQEHLYTESETLEIVQGVAKAVGSRAFELGKSQKCERQI